MERLQDVLYLFLTADTDAMRLPGAAAPSPHPPSPALPVSQREINTVQALRSNERTNHAVVLLSSMAALRGALQHSES